MRYVLAIIGGEGAMEDATPEQTAEVMGAWQAFTDELRDSGAFIAGEGLAPSASATTVRIGEGGERTTTDGPFAETKEQLGGFYLIECDNLDQALEWAKKIPAQAGAIEVRPVMDYEAAGMDEPQAQETAAS
jgi:hypothetical protein